jgi:hypothetical protein
MEGGKKNISQKGNATRDTKVAGSTLLATGGNICDTEG